MNHSISWKVTHTDAYLKPDSHHHPSQKNSLIKTLHHRAQSISDHEHLTSKLKHVHQAQGECIFWQHNTQSHQPKREEGAIWGSNQIHHLAIHSRGNQKYFQNHEHKIQVQCNTLHKIRDPIPSVKDKIPDMQYPGVYKLSCICSSSYIGETMRHISDRVREHKADLKHGRTNTSAVADNYFNAAGSHEIDFSKTMVLCKPTGYQQRFVHEAIHISRHNFNWEDGYKLSNHWKDVISHFGTWLDLFSCQPPPSAVWVCAERCNDCLAALWLK